jgi:selenocysteine lyase/cysteine desulfurase
MAGGVEAVDRAAFVGVDEPVPLLDGGQVPYVNLDNAATTPALREVVDTVDRFLPWYSSVHRGTGYTSRLSTAAYERARELVAEFVGADPERDVVLFTRNTTEALNRLARSLRMPLGSVVLTTILEHHSNDLPWRPRARTFHVRALADGSLDEDHVDHLLAQHAGRVALLAVSGASNVTGLIPPVHRLAEKVHAAGGLILVDAAQLAAHRAIDMGGHDDPGHIDFVALSAHKMYAPFGAGALIGRRDAFRADPDHAGGGTIRAVSVDDVVWADLPDREEAGSPNVVGAVALAATTLALGEIGLDHISVHEADLTHYAMARLRRVPGLRFYGPHRPGPIGTRLGVIPFNLEGLDHGLVAAALGYEHGIGVRHGCFCAHPYIAHLMGVSRAESVALLAEARVGQLWDTPGMVRISFGCYNDFADVDRVVDALEHVAAGDIHGTYRAGPDGSYRPDGYMEPRLFDFDTPAAVGATSCFP